MDGRPFARARDVRLSAWSGGVYGALAGVVAVAVLELGNAAWGLPFVPFVVFEWVIRILPGAVVTFGIDVVVAAIRGLGLGETSTLAKLAEQAMAIGMFVGGSVILGAIVAWWLGDRATRARALGGGAVAGAVQLAIALVAVFARESPTVIDTGWLALVFGVWGVALGAVLRAHDVRAGRSKEPGHLSRRRFLLVAIAGAGALSTLLVALAHRLRGGRAHTPASGPSIDLSQSSGPAASPAAEALAARIDPAPGTRPELTSTDTFYRVDINLRPPEVDAQTWRLVVDGLVDEPLSLSLEELRAMPAVSQVITLECISNPIAGDLIGTALWTGVRLADVLALAGIRGGAHAVHIQAADGFYESVALADVADPRTLLVHAMNEAPLTAAHGFPLRIYIPDRHGMKQPKWITRLTASDRDGPGYWVDRGWSATAIPHTTSVIDTIGAPDDDAVAIGGIAYAGARGIRAVEVQVDDGPWVAARLVAPALSPLSWVLWRYDWRYVPGDHVFRVRAYDGTGARQTVDVHAPHPAGATGLHAVERRFV